MSIELNRIYNENCFKTMERMDASVDVVLTSPPYNTNKKAGKTRTLKTTKSEYYPYLRYDSYSDAMTNEEYCAWTAKLFNEFDRILVKNGVVLYNLSYGNENVEGLFTAINAIITDTPFTVADIIVWKKSAALPNNNSSNRLTRIVEYVFVLCRKTEAKTFFCNKGVSSVRSSGQKVYHNIFNFIAAPNNTEKCPYNKATYSVELCDELLKVYAPEGGAVYDPFMGSGTTAASCVGLGLSYIGSEISDDQCKWAEDRIERVKAHRLAPKSVSKHRRGRKKRFGQLSFEEVVKTC